MNGDADAGTYEAYRRHYESVMGDSEEAGVAAADAFTGPSTYTERMLDVLGSDGEEEVVQGYSLEVGSIQADTSTPAAPALEDTSAVDDEVSQSHHANGVPPSLSSNESAIMPMSPSIMSISDDGAARTPSALLPYGSGRRPKQNGAGADTDSNADTETDTIADSKEKSAITLRAFLRVSRLCSLTDKEGSPTVMAVASGVIAVGTIHGKVALFDRSRGWTGAVSVEGSITALAISSDKASLAIGTSNGHIYIYDLQRLQAASRHVPPVTAQAVTSGRSEGHLPHSRILHVSFVGARHTAVVSADDHGLSFYHSLGKIFGVSSNDTLRILGRYADAFTEGSNPRKSTVLAMSTLPLGPQRHVADANTFVALLTPSKLVLVGLTPAARTWYRRLSPERNAIDAPICGCLAWMPCTSVATPSSVTLKGGLVPPTLAFTFGRYLYLIRLHAPSDAGQDVGVREWKSWTHDEPIEALQWLSHESIALYAKRTMKLYDVRRGTCTEEQSFLRPASQPWVSDRIGGRETLPSLGGTVKSHKGQLFVLTPKELLVAALISWADRLLAHVAQGDSLGAIQQATEYLRDPQAGGSRIGLPESYDEQRPLIASRLTELMRASTSYAFSEERMKDDMTHYPQGVDRTPLFETLARVCAEACLALDDFSFLFDELYDTYSEAGIESVFAEQMEQFIVQGVIRTLPIPVVQHLVALRTRQRRYDLAERIIRNVDPSCLDLDQVIGLCLEHQMYDALIYVYDSVLSQSFSGLNDMLRQSQNGARVQTTVLQALPRLVDVDADKCAAMIKRLLPNHIHEAIGTLDRSPHRQLTLLHVFFDRDTSFADSLGLIVRAQYLALLCSLEPSGVVKVLDRHDTHYFDLQHVIEVTTDEDVLDALLWAYDRSDRTDEGLKMMADALAERAMVLRAGAGDDASSSPSQRGIDDDLLAREQIEQLAEMAVRICTERAQESLWVTVLQHLIRLSHSVRQSASAVEFARGVLQDALSSFVSSTSADDISFSVLFRSLAPAHQNSTYAEVRDIFDAMMGAYKVRRELLGITNRLFSRDVFTALHRLTRQRRRGWRPSSTAVQCPGCGQPCIGDGGECEKAEAGKGRRSMSTSVSLSDMQPTSASSPLLRRQSSTSTPRRDKGKRVMRGEDSNDGTLSVSQDGAMDDENSSAARSHEMWREGSAEDDYFRSALPTGRNMSDPTETFLATPSLAALAQADVTLPVSHDTTLQVVTDEVPASRDGVVVCFSGEVWHQQCAPAHLLKAAA